MRSLRVIPKGWPVKLGECPPGLFSFTGDIGFKSEYFTDDPEKIEVFCAESGECFWGGVTSKQARMELMVQPVVLEWHEE